MAFARRDLAGVGRSGGTRARRSAGIRRYGAARLPWSCGVRREADGREATAFRAAAAYVHVTFCNYRCTLCFTPCARALGRREERTAALEAELESVHRERHGAVVRRRGHADRLTPAFSPYLDAVSPHSAQPARAQGRSFARVDAEGISAWWRIAASAGEQGIGASTARCERCAADRFRRGARGADDPRRAVFD